jgi:hypothetical protein
MGEHLAEQARRHKLRRRLEKNSRQQPTESLTWVPQRLS